MTNRPIGEDDLQAYVDGRLDTSERLAVEDYLAGNAQAAEQVAAWTAQRDALRASLAAKADEPIPARLRIANVRAVRARNRWAQLRVAAASVALLIAGGAAGWTAHGYRPVPRTIVVSDANAAFRTFVVETAHPVEVKAAERDHLVQWLSNRLGHQIRTPDLSSFGFRLLGGRVLPAADGAVAAQLMYADDTGKRLTLYVRNREQGSAKSRFITQGDVSAAYWIGGGLGFAVTGLIDQPRLERVVDAVSAQLTQG